jgi:hypothetical protein
MKVETTFQSIAQFCRIHRGFKAHLHRELMKEKGFKKVTIQALDRWIHIDGKKRVTPRYETAVLILKVGEREMKQWKD